MLGVYCAGEMNGFASDLGQPGHDGSQQLMVIITGFENKEVPRRGHRSHGPDITRLANNNNIKNDDLRERSRLSSDCIIIRDWRQ